MVNENSGLCAFWIKRIAIPERVIGFDDQMQMAKVGLVRAYRKYDPSKGKFSTWAAFFIKRELTLVLYEAKRQKRSGRSGEVKTGSDSADMKNFSVACGMTDRVDAKQVWKESMKVLTDREREVVVGRLRRGEMLHEIGSRIGLTRERVRQIYEEALDKLREFYNVEDR